MARRSLSFVLCAVLVLMLAIPAVVLSASPASAALLHTWYLAEGSTAWGFGTYINIENPNAVAVNIQITYRTPGGPLVQPPFPVAAESRATVNPFVTIGMTDFSTQVTCLDGLTISVDRSMFWMGGPGSDANRIMEIASSIGVNNMLAPNPAWWLPEGSSAWGFETWLCIQNPNPVVADCQVTYMIEGFGPFTVNKTVGPNSRESFSMAADIGSADASIEVQSPQGIICERAMYRNHRRMGHSSVGYPWIGGQVYLAEGTTAWGFTTYLTVQNPDAAFNIIQVTYMKPSGPVVMPAFSMAPRTRKTIRVNDVLANSDCSIKVESKSGGNVLAERPMYWGGNSIWGEAGHDSIGVDQPHHYWYMPGGSCAELFETWTCVQNPNPVPVTVRVEYFSEVGPNNVSFLDVISGQSRKSYNMADHAPLPGRYAIRVTCMNAGLDVIAERATYLWTMAGSLSARTGGEGTIGGWNNP